MLEFSRIHCDRNFMPNIDQKDQARAQVKDGISVEKIDFIFLIIGGLMFQPAWRGFTLAINTLKNYMKLHQTLIIAVTKK